jgi:hypothetical protein
MTTFTAVDPFSFDRLYGNEKYSLNDMLLKETAQVPRSLDPSDESWEIWSDHCRTEWGKALEGAKSEYNGDAYFAGMSDEEFLAFASRLVSLIAKRDVQITGAAIVRYTDGGGYPTLRLSAVKVGKTEGRRWGIPLNRPKFDRRMDELGEYLG